MIRSLLSNKPRFQFNHKPFLLVGLLAVLSSAHAQNIKPDSSFGQDGQIDLGNLRMHTFRVLKDGKILVLGSNRDNLSTSPYHVFTRRLFPNGRIDSSYGKHGEGYIQPIPRLDLLAIQSDGKLVESQESIELAEVFIARYLADRPDSSYGVNGKTKISLLGSSVQDFVDLRGTYLDQNNNAIAFGHYWITESSPDMMSSIAVSADSNGTAFQPYYYMTPGTANENYCLSMVVQPDKKPVFAGWTQPITLFGDHMYIARMALDASHDPSFYNGFAIEPSVGQGFGQVVTLQADGKILCMAEYAIVRLNQNGFLDSSFGVDGIKTTLGDPLPLHFQNLASLPNGKILASGTFNGFKTLQRFMPNGALDNAFGSSSLYVIELPGENYLKTPLEIIGADTLLTGNGRYLLKYILQNTVTETERQKSQPFFSLVPNPTIGKVRIHIANASSGAIQIRSILGQTIHSSQITSAETELNLSGLQAGIYSIRVESDGKTMEQKLVKW